MPDTLPSATNGSTVSQSVVTFLLAEYAALRDEVLKRIEILHQLISLALIAVGTLLPLGVQTSTTIIFAYPVVALFLAASWAHNNARIQQVGAYIRRHIEAELLSERMGWEHMRRQLNDGQFGARNLLASRGIFVGTQLLAIFIGLLRSTFPVEDIVFLVIDGIAVAATLVVLQQHKVTL